MMKGAEMFCAVSSWSLVFTEQVLCFGSGCLSTLPGKTFLRDKFSSIAATYVSDTPKQSREFTWDELQMAERCSWHCDARRVAGLHLLIIVIWVLLLPLLPMEGCWYFVSAVRNLCSIHLRHLRLISACTWRRGGEVHKQEDEGAIRGAREGGGKTRFSDIKGR